MLSCASSATAAGDIEQAFMTAASTCWQLRAITDQAKLDKELCRYPQQS